MKTKLKQCIKCEEETRHDEGKNQATSKRGAYNKRTTSRCRRCGTREIYNIKTKKRYSIAGKNEFPMEAENEIYP